MSTYNGSLDINGVNTPWVLNVADGGSGGAGASETPNDQEGITYTLQLSDAGMQTVWMNSASATTVTIPANASVPYPIGTIAYINRGGLGLTSITSEAGVLVNGVSSGVVTIPLTYGEAKLTKRGVDIWSVSGDVTAVVALFENLVPDLLLDSTGIIVTHGTVTPGDTMVVETETLMKFTGVAYNPATITSVRYVPPTDLLTVGSEYEVSCLVHNNSANDQMVWMRDGSVDLTKPHGQKAVKAGQTIRIKTFVKATAPKLIDEYSSPLVLKGSGTGDDIYFLYNSDPDGNLADGDTLDLYIGGFDITERIAEPTGVALIGDSTMVVDANVDTQSPQGRGVPVFTAGDLMADVIGRAKGGDTIGQMVARWTADMTPIMPNCKYVILEGGINNIIFAGGDTPGGLATMKIDFQALYDLVIAAGKTAIVLNSTPSASTVSDVDREANRQAFNTWLAANFPVVVDISALIDEPGSPGTMQSQYWGPGSDKTHFNHAAKKIIGELIASNNVFDFSPSVPAAPSTPATPTGGVVDDVADTFAFTALLSLSEYEFNTTGAAPWSTVTANPIAIGDVAINAGDVQVRVKAAGGNNPSLALVSDAAFTVSAGQSFTWNASAGVTALDDHIEKVSGSDFAVQAYTDESITGGDMTITFDLAAGAEGKAGMIGFNTTPAASTGYVAPFVGMYLDASSRVNSVKDGTWTLGTEFYTDPAPNSFSIVYDDTAKTVEVKYGALVSHTMTSVDFASAEVFLDSSLGHNGFKLENITFT